MGSKPFGHFSHVAENVAGLGHALFSPVPFLVGMKIIDNFLQTFAGVFVHAIFLVS